MVVNASQQKLRFTVFCDGLQGGRTWTAIRLSAGISVRSFYRIVHLCMDAILLCPDLAFSLPVTATEIADALTAFKAISSKGVIDGCVGCVDGLLMKIQTPSNSEVGNVKSFFSGHYQTYGINVQAACDAKCRFISVCIAAPGGTNDIAAFRKSPLFQLVQNLPIGNYIIGDDAYVCTEKILTPFSGRKW